MHIQSSLSYRQWLQHWFSTHQGLAIKQKQQQWVDGYCAQLGKNRFLDVQWSALSSRLHWQTERGFMYHVGPQSSAAHCCIHRELWPIGTHCVDHLVWHHAHEGLVALPAFMSLCAESVRILKPGGKLISITGPVPEEEYKANNAWGTMTFVRPSGEQIALIAKLFDDGKIKTNVDSVFPLAETAAAHDANESGHTRGKIVISIPS